MNEPIATEVANVMPTFPFDGEARDINGELCVGWEVKDDYGNVVHRASWRNGKEWSDPELAPIDSIESLKSKAQLVRESCLKKVLAITKADLPLPEEEDSAESMIPVPERISALWEDLGLVLTEKGSPVNNMDNCVRILEQLEGFKGRIWLDEFTRCIVTNFSCKTGEEEREWTDHDSRQLWLEVQRRIGICRIGKDTVFEAVCAYAHMNRRHPVKEWLRATEWDRVPRLDTFFQQYMGADDTAFNRAAASNFFLSMLARVYDPGCKVDNMVVLEGDQGVNKSSALKALCGKWFTECNEPISNGNNKDFYAVLQGKMLVEIAELDSFSRADIKRIKAIISTATDRYRPAYGRIAENFPRTSVFVGTTNEDEYLEDPTGGRRFWPVKTRVFRLDEIRTDRAQLFAEALHRYRVKPEWWVVPKEEAAAQQELRRKRDAWENIIEAWMALPRMIPGVTSTQILGEAMKIDPERMDHRASVRVAYCMKVLGYKNRVVKESGVMKRVWMKS